MGLFDRITLDEKNMIRRYIDDYAIDNAHWERKKEIDYILRIWDESKSQYLSKLFPEDALIMSKEICVQKDQEMLNEDFERVLWSWGSKAHKFYENYRRAIDKYCHCGWELEGKFLRLISNDDLGTNIYDGDTFTVKFDNGDEYKVQRGCKTSKALGKIAEGFNIEGFEDFRILHSQVLNEKTFKGDLHLSIHPLDFMTSSDNECGWCSCMSWTDGGEYRRGTVEMMNSVSVIEAYLTASEPFHIAGGEWTNKKWRQYFIVTPTFVTAVKGYPYWNRDLENVTMQWLCELAEEKLGYGPYLKQKVTFHSSDRFYIPELNRYSRFYFYTDAMYCDFCYDHCAYVSPDIMENVEFSYSGPSECMCCGSVSASFDHEGMLSCENCEEVYRCDCCGDHYDRDELYEVDGYLYCHYCYDDLPVCDCCDQVHTNDYMYNGVYLADTEGVYMDTEHTFCEDCMRDFGLLEIIDERHQSWSYYTCIPIEKMDDKMAGAFGYESYEDMVEQLTKAKASNDEWRYRHINTQN